MEISEYIKLIPEWLTATGTLLAVIVALYLARRDKSIQCVGDSSIYVVIDPGLTDSRSEYVILTVTNVGTRGFTLKGLSWRMGIVKRKYYFLVPPPNTYSSRIPTKLADGDQAAFYFPIENFRKNDRPLLLTSSPKFFKPIWLLFSCLVVHTTTGQSFTFKMNKSIRQELLDNRDL